MKIDLQSSSLYLVMAMMCADAGQVISQGEWSEGVRGYETTHIQTP